MQTWGVENDVIITPSMARAMALFYPMAEIEHRVVLPRDINLKRISHFGFSTSAAGQLGLRCSIKVEAG